MELPDDPSKLGMGAYSSVGVDITKSDLNYSKAVSTLPWQLRTDDVSPSPYTEDDNIFSLGGSCW